MPKKDTTLTDAKRFGSTYKVRGGKIYDEANVRVTPREVANDAKRAAEKARSNAEASRKNKPLLARVSAFANRTLQGTAEHARDAIREANRQNAAKKSVRKKKGK